ncbi:hypothetical protein D9M68_638110 [compost metagenome]
MVFQNFRKIRTKISHNHNHRIGFWICGKVINDLVTFHYITGGQGFLQFKNIIFFTDAYIFLNMIGLYHRIFIHIEAEFFYLIGNFGEIIPQILSHQRCSLRCDLISFSFDMFFNPWHQFIITYRIGLKYYPISANSFINLLSLVEICVFIG